MAQEKILGNQLNLNDVASELSPLIGGGDLVDDTTPQLGGDLDVNGHNVKGVDVAVVGNAGDVVVQSGSSTLNGADSYAGRVTIKGGDRTYIDDYHGVAPDGSPPDRDSVKILGGVGGGYGGGIQIAAGGTDAYYGEGGDVTISAGAASHATHGYGGHVNIITPNNASTYQYSLAGEIRLTGGDSDKGYAGAIEIKAGNSTNHTYAGLTSPAGGILIKAGDVKSEGSPAHISPATFAGSVDIRAGSGNENVGGDTSGGDVRIYGGNGAFGGTGSFGGNIILDPGTGSGVGEHGKVLPRGNIDMVNAYDIEGVKNIQYKDERVLVPVGSPPGSSNQIQFTQGRFATLTLINVNSIAFTSFGSLKTGMYQLRLVNGASYPPSSWQNVKWPNNTEPTWTDSASGDIITFFYDGTPTGSPPNPANIYYAINVALGFE